MEREWDKEKLQALNQLNIFDTVKTERPKVVKKLPYEFSYLFKDDKGKEAKIMIEDWELGQLYWNCLKDQDEETACKKVRYKYLDDFAKTKDLHFYLGTAKQFQLVSPNPFLVIGTFHPKFPKHDSRQGNLFAE